jgi:hypothetical protein
MGVFGPFIHQNEGFIVVFGQLVGYGAISSRIKIRRYKICRADGSADWIGKNAIGFLCFNEIRGVAPAHIIAPDFNPAT